MTGYVYILANRKNGTLYMGVTNSILRRTIEHKAGQQDGFTKKYQTTKLVWYEGFDNFLEAIAFEKRIKKWRRSWKIKMIEKMNPDWKDLYNDLIS